MARSKAMSLCGRSRLASRTIWMRSRYFGSASWRNARSSRSDSSCGKWMRITPCLPSRRSLLYPPSFYASDSINERLYKAGTPLLKSNLLRRVFRPLAQRAGLPALRFHDLRHAHVIMLLSQGCSLKALSQRLGHANPTMTLRVYAHVLPTDDQALASRLDGLLG